MIAPRGDSPRPRDPCAEVLAELRQVASTLECSAAIAQECDCPQAERAYQRAANLVRDLISRHDPDDFPFTETRHEW